MPLPSELLLHLDPGVKTTTQNVPSPDSTRENLGLMTSLFLYYNKDQDGGVEREPVCQER